MKKLHFCTHLVNRKHIKRENRKGVEHVILTSYTLPPDIVMNGGLYPADEIEKSFKSLNRTPVTVEHPEVDGMYVSANDPEVDFDFRFGAFNENARKLDDGRVALDKVINVQKALKTEKGKRLLDRIEELETNEMARPIHTSVGVFVDVEDVELSTNAKGQEFTWIAKNMIFDHDAILLDSIGASTPDQGTGIGINKEQLKVSHFIVGANERKIKAKNYLTNELSFSQVECALHKLINKDTNGNEYNYIVAVYDDYFIFETKNEMFKSNYEVDDLDNVSIQGTRLPVERVVEFKPINSTDIKEDNAMRDSIIAELAKLGITVNADVTDAELMAKYKEALVANEGDDGADGENVAEIVANAIKEAINPLTEKISGLETQLTANSNKDLEELAQFVVSSKKRPEFDLESLKSLGVDTVRNIAANCGFTSSIGSTMHVNNTESDAFVTNVADLPD
tara:strand:+ start:17592 stop:18947 length:1356 start_codon:yes stop_codon:yes gene_type:complete